MKPSTQIFQILDYVRFGAIDFFRGESITLKTQSTTQAFHMEAPLSRTLSNPDCGLNSQFVKNRFFRSGCPTYLNILERPPRSSSLLL